jgi:hypothetical protein
VNPIWEVDTWHEGFDSCAAAALEANRVGSEAALRVDGGAFSIEWPDARRELVRTVEVWERLKCGPFQNTPEDACFERVDVGAQVLSKLGLDRSFQARMIRVVDDLARHDVRLAWVVVQGELMVVVEPRGETKDDDESLA